MFIMSSSQLFYGVSEDIAFDHGPLLEERSSTTSIILFHNSSNMLNFSRGIRHQLRFLSTMGFLVVH